MKYSQDWSMEKTVTQCHNETSSHIHIFGDFCF